MLRRMLSLTAALVFAAVSSFAADLPVSGPITSGIGWRIDPFGSGRMIYHRGIDIAVPLGTPVHPTGAGTVVFAGEDGGYGKTVIVRHGPGEETLYGHNSQILAKVGESITPESVIALSGSSGRSTGPHVHYEVRGAGAPSAAVLATASPRQEHFVEKREQEHKLDEILQSLQAKIRGEAIPADGAVGGD